MSQSATPIFRFSVPAALPLEASFDGGRLTSDGGLPWLEQAEQRSALRCLRRGSSPTGAAVRCGMPLETLLRQRIFQIACGYEDQDDAELPAHRPAVEAGLWPPPGDRARSGQPTDLLPAGERGRSTHLLPVGPDVGRALSAASGSEMACPRTSCWTWMARTIPRMGSRKGAPTTATTGSTCTTPCSSLTARRASSSPPCCAPAIRMAVPVSSRC